MESRVKLFETKTYPASVYTSTRLVFGQISMERTALKLHGRRIDRKTRKTGRRRLIPPDVLQGIITAWSWRGSECPPADEPAMPLGAPGRSVPVVDGIGGSKFSI